MASPIIDKNTPWAHGKSRRYTLSNNGTFVGHVHPPGEALRIPKSYAVDDDLTFIECTNRIVRGKCQGFLAASSAMPFNKYDAGTTFHPQLVIVMGIDVSTDGNINYYYYQWGGIGNYGSVKKAMNKFNKPTTYIRKMFHPKLYKAKHGEIYFSYLNQISGPTFACLKPKICIAQRRYVIDYYDGMKEHHGLVELHPKFTNKRYVTNVFFEQGPCPDNWVPKGQVYSNQEKRISFLTSSSATKHIDIYNSTKFEEDKEDVAIESGTKSIMNLGEYPTIVIFTKRQEFPVDADDLLWMPLPMDNEEDDDFIHVAGITKLQKQQIDYDIYNNIQEDDNYKMTSSKFRSMLEAMSLNNCGAKYIRKRKLVCGGKFLGTTAYNYIISCIEDEDIPELESYHNCTRIGIDDDTFMYITDKNEQDPHFPGVVVWRIYLLPARDMYSSQHVHLTLKTFPNAGLNRDCTINTGHMSMAFVRQGSKSNGSLNQVSSPTNHNYNDPKQIDLSLAPFTSSLFGTLANLSTIASDKSGQVITGTIKKALVYDNPQNAVLNSKDICPYVIHSSLRYNSILGCFEVFANCYHNDTHDQMDKVISRHVINYLDQCHSPTLQAYFEKVLDMYKDILVLKDGDVRIPLHTTCAYKLIEQPEDKLVVHHSYFIVEGMALDLSSNVFANNNFDYVANTFLGKLAWHCTTLSTWEDKLHGHVTTLMPGLAANQGWGSSGGYAYIRATTDAGRDAAVVDLLNTRIAAGSGIPNSLPGLSQQDIRRYFNCNRSNLPRGPARLPASSQNNDNDRGSRSSSKRKSGTSSGGNDGSGGGSGDMNNSNNKRPRRDNDDSGDDSDDNSDDSDDSGRIHENLRPYLDSRGDNNSDDDMEQQQIDEEGQHPQHYNTTSVRTLHHAPTIDDNMFIENVNRILRFDRRDGNGCRKSRPCL